MTTFTTQELDDIQTALVNYLDDRKEYVLPYVDEGSEENEEELLLIQRLRELISKVSNPPTIDDAARWQFLVRASSEVTLRIHNSRCDQRQREIDEFINRSTP